LPTKEEMKKIAKEQEKTFLKISRVPFYTKETFVAYAENEFAGDYGLLLKFLLEQAIEYQRVKEVLLDKEFLIHILDKFQEEKQEKPVKRTFSGRIVKGGSS